MGPNQFAPLLELSDDLSDRAEVRSLIVVLTWELIVEFHSGFIWPLTLSVRISLS